MHKKHTLNRTFFVSGYKEVAMCRLLCSLILILLVSACAEPVPPGNNTTDQTVFRPAKYIAKLQPGQQADGVLVKFVSGTSQSSRSRSLSSAGLKERAQFALVPGLRLTSVAPGQTVNSTLSTLATDPNVAYAEPNYIYTIDTIPNDTNFSQQWALNNSSDTDINAPEAWDLGTGSTDVIIAVIDSGVDYNHPDLQNQIWTNPGEIPGNNRDDDGNGFVDDVHGWDFESNDNDPMDENDHGTHVAGIIGAEVNNNRGVAGVNWHVRIMPLKFMNPQGSGTTAAAISALDYAVKNGARISNNSWGGGAFSQALFDAIQRANNAGHTFFAAAGNDGVNNDNSLHYPSSYNLPNIISVASLDQNGRLSSFSNFGVRTVDIAAPGSQILSTVPNGGYQSFSGTSMATPFVTGTAGLLLAKNPNLTIAQLRDALLNNVTPVAALSNQIASGGRLNAFAAVRSITSAAPSTPTPVTITTPGISNLTVGDTLNLTATGGTTPYSWASSNNTIASVSSRGVVTAVTPGNFQITVNDSNGVSSPPLRLSVTATAPTTAVLSISPSNLTQIDVNTNQTFNISGGTTPYNWRSSSVNVATVSSNTSGSSATVTANNAGTFTLTISDANNATITTSTIEVVANASLNISAPKTTLNVGETTQLTASGGTSPYTWRSSSVNVATVDNGGLVKAVGAGFASISTTDSTGAQTSVNINVNQSTGGALTISPANSAMGIGAIERLIATGGGLQINWTSSNPSVATIDSRGVVKATGAGTATISASDELSNQGSTRLDVKEISISASVLTIGAGDTLQLSADGGSQPYTWSVSNNTLASINSSGLLSSILGSTGGILVTAKDADGVSKSIIVTINGATTLRAPLAQ